jgi:hypothetical protein
MRRAALGLVGSLALHGAGLVTMALVRGPAVRVAYEIDVVDAPPAPPRDDAHEGEPRPPRAAARSRRVASSGGTLRESRPTPPATPETDSAPLPDLQPLAPTSARLVVLLRTDRLRQSPLAEAAGSGMQALPDGSLAVSQGLDPLEDFDALLVATANPRDVTQTFLAARLAHPERVRERFAAPGGLDPRVLVYPSERVGVLGRPEHVQAIGGGWVKALSRFADDPGGASLVEITVNGLSGVLEVGPLRVILPRSGQARLSWPPAVRARAEYESAADAQEMAAAWPRMSREIEGSLVVRMFGLGGVTSHARVEVKDNVLVLEAPLEQRHLEAISTAIKLLMARAHAVPQ